MTCPKCGFQFVTDMEFHELNCPNNHLNTAPKP